MALHPWTRPDRCAVWPGSDERGPCDRPAVDVLFYLNPNIYDTPICARCLAATDSARLHAMQTDEVVLYRVKVVERATGKTLPIGAAILARSDVEAADALEREFPSKRYRWFDRADGHEVTGLIDADQRRR